MQSNLLSKGTPAVACTALVVLVLMLASSVAAQTGATYYVSTTGKNGNAGTIDAPWLTIQHAASKVTAGATVYVFGGVYNESVNFPRSGTASAPITFQSYPGQTAVIDGTGVTCCGSSQTHGLINITGHRSYITISGFEIRNYTTSGANPSPSTAGNIRKDSRIRNRATADNSRSNRGEVPHSASRPSSRASRTSGPARAVRRRSSRRRRGRRPGC